MLHKENVIYTSTVACTLLLLKHQTVFHINLNIKQTVIMKRYTRKMQFTDFNIKQTVIMKRYTRKIQFTDLMLHLHFYC